ncbi:hypothetical protein CRE_30054 [Caenorhabditis remanei]|uniref:mitogen-activated protein kinase kinase n=1 Tax=Caenorhabditis remanei TaxID=31234 RepID=E3MYF3_CAERE|nr:hypothetical protein CRE_30054 [Caenorhabditis remanei]
MEIPSFFSPLTFFLISSSSLFLDRFIFIPQNFRMSSGKRRNPLGLSLPPTVNEQSENGEAAAEEANPTVPLEEQLKKLGLTEPQTQRLSEFLLAKEGIKELSEDMLQTEGELGHGNGGVVNKCVHKKTGVIMARKLVHLEIKPSPIYCWILWCFR